MRKQIIIIIIILLGGCSNRNIDNEDTGSKDSAEILNILEGTYISSDRVMMSEETDRYQMAVSDYYRSLRPTFYSEIVIPMISEIDPLITIEVNKKGISINDTTLQNTKMNQQTTGNGNQITITGEREGNKVTIRSSEPYRTMIIFEEYTLDIPRWNVIPAARFLFDHDKEYIASFETYGDNYSFVKISNIELELTEEQRKLHCLESLTISQEQIKELASKIEIRSDNGELILFGDNESIVVRTGNIDSVITKVVIDVNKCNLDFDKEQMISFAVKS